MVCRDEFKTLSQGQIDIITQVLQSRGLLSAEIAASINSLKTGIDSHLDKQDVQLTENTRLVSLLPDTMEQSEAKVLRRLSAQDAHFQEAASQTRAAEDRWQREQQQTLRRRLLEALAFPEMEARRNKIESQVSDVGSTYVRFFECCDSLADNAGMDIDHHLIPNSLLDSAARDFTKWLRSREDIFWISGKPGSGKSTLMNFIYHYLRPKRLDFKTGQAGATSMPVKVLSFWFFRPTDAKLLHSLQGFWRSLCFQILACDESLYSTICKNDDGSAPNGLRSAISHYDSFAQSWTDSELRLWLLYLIKHSKFKFWLLVDGLDELKDGQSLLLETFKLLASDSAHAKILCSSRPE